MTDHDTNAATAAAYYDEADVAAFYRLCWGGADIHIGRYDTGAKDIADASQAMTRHLLGLAGLRAGDRVLDIACGYGGTLRALAQMGCRASGIDISQVCVDAARRANAAAGLAAEITVAVGDFHAINSADAAFDACVCQEAIIHSTDKPQVFREVSRILRPGGVFAFSDILTAERADLALVEAAFARLRTPAGATAGDYATMARAAGFEIVHEELRPADIRTHYARLAERLSNPPPELAPPVVERLSESVARWRTALAGGHITWGCFIARKAG